MEKKTEELRQSSLVHESEVRRLRNEIQQKEKEVRRLRMSAANRVGQAHTLFKTCRLAFHSFFLISLIELYLYLNNTIMYLYLFVLC